MGGVQGGHKLGQSREQTFLLLVFIGSCRVTSTCVGCFPDGRLKNRKAMLTLEKMLRIVARCYILRSKRHRRDDYKCAGAPR